MPKKSIPILYMLLILMALPTFAQAGVDTSMTAMGNVIAPLGQGGTYPTVLAVPQGPPPYRIEVKGCPQGVRVSAPMEHGGVMRARVTVPPSTPAGAWPMRLAIIAANGQTQVDRLWLLVNGLFVTVAGKHPHVLAYSPTGLPVAMPGSFTGVSQPVDMAYVAKDNTLYVADYGQDISGGNPGGIRVFSSAGAPAVGDGFAEITHPTVITHDEGRFLVAGNSGSNWWIMNDAGLVIGQSGVGSPVFSRWDSSPQGIASAQGKAYIPWGEGYPSGVRVFTLNGRRILMPGAFPDTGGTEQHMDTPMASPTGIAWDPITQDVYVMYAIDHAHSHLAIRVYDPKGQPVPMPDGFHGLGRSSAHHVANQITASAITGDIYAISSHHTVIIYSPDGDRIGSFPIPAKATAILAVPYDWLRRSVPIEQSNSSAARTVPPACPSGYTCVPAQSAGKAEGGVPVRKQIPQDAANVVQNATNQVSNVNNLAWSLSNLVKTLH